MKRDYTPHPKPKKRARKQIRIHDKTARERKLDKDRLCRRWCGRIATDAHHIVRKGSPHFGDDVEDNLMPLCHRCHMRWHDGRIRRLDLTSSEKDYVFGKLGREPGLVYLEDHYGLEVSA